VAQEDPQATTAKGQQPNRSRLRYDRDVEAFEVIQATTNQFYYSVRATNQFGTKVSAEALLYVHNSAAARLSDYFAVSNQFIMTISGVTNRAYAVEASTNLSNWVAVHTNYVTFNFTNQITTNYPHRFFRANAQ
jgi:hypothetical protein